MSVMETQPWSLAEPEPEWRFCQIEDTLLCSSARKVSRPGLSARKGLNTYMMAWLGP